MHALVATLSSQRCCAVSVPSAALAKCNAAAGKARAASNLPGLASGCIDMLRGTMAESQLQLPGWTRASGLSWLQTSSKTGPVPEDSKYY